MAPPAKIKWDKIRIWDKPIFRCPFKPRKTAPPWLLVLIESGLADTGKLREGSPRIGFLEVLDESRLSPELKLQVVRVPKRRKPKVAK